MLLRRATRDARVGHQEISKGSQVAVVISSANRESGAFQHPELISLTRHNNQHISFGFGAHRCLGAAIARTEAEIALETLATAHQGSMTPLSVTWSDNAAMFGPIELIVGMAQAD